ncbi:MAG: hypothetical protein A2V86_09615 [Deltaproteobacteria bacterium RBG_16_49_23]|nr:MAG: hypothetical protein A2V86_09615 [Deltaproteobacteria bacterium RBG_16_49_23]
MFVILNEVKNLMISTESIIEILRLSPQNDITTQSQREEKDFPLLAKGDEGGLDRFIQRAKV